jgi:type III secretion protein J
MKKTVLLLLATVLLTGCLKNELGKGMSDAESQEIIVLLEENGLRASRQPDAAETGQQKGAAAYTIFVQGTPDQLVEAWRILRANGLPKERVRGLEQVYENSSLIPTASQEKARLLSGLAGELSRTLQLIPGVVDARVHLVIPENSPLVAQADWKPTTASVLIMYKSVTSPLSEAQIKQMVSKGVEGLVPDNVSVIYNKVTPKVMVAKTLWWYLGNQVLLLFALIIAVITTLTSLTLMARTRSLKGQVEMLRKKPESELPARR